jgi:serine/threonine-protein kinase
MFPDPTIATVISSFLAGAAVCAAARGWSTRRVRPASAEATEREIGSYQLLDRLGSGGMGEVWIARHQLLARPAALKLIRPELLGADERRRTKALKRFAREARETASLRSMHTISVYDFGVTRHGAFYYTMELLDGLNLHSLIRQFGPVEPARAVFLLRQVCHSIGEAHDRGLVHRDIKPANIFVCRQGPDVDFVKVLDFGLAQIAADAELSSLTDPGRIVGTPAYMAPEVASGRATDRRADIYAIGCVAYWLLTGELVFAGETSVATALQHMTADPVRPSLRTEVDIPRALEEAVLGCLAKDPAERPQTVAELDALLADAVPGHWHREDSQRWWHLHQPTRRRPADAATATTAPMIHFAMPCASAGA